MRCFSAAKATVDAATATAAHATFKNLADIMIARLLFGQDQLVLRRQTQTISVLTVADDDLPRVFQQVVAGHDIVENFHNARGGRVRAAGLMSRRRHFVSKALWVRGVRFTVALTSVKAHWGP